MSYRKQTFKVSISLWLWTWFWFRHGYVNTIYIFGEYRLGVLVPCTNTTKGLLWAACFKRVWIRDDLRRKRNPVLCLHIQTKFYASSQLKIKCRKPLVRKICISVYVHILENVSYFRRVVISVWRKLVKKKGQLKFPWIFQKSQLIAKAPVWHTHFCTNRQWNEPFNIQLAVRGNAPNTATLKISRKKGFGIAISCSFLVEEAYVGGVYSQLSSVVENA